MSMLQSALHSFWYLAGALSGVLIGVSHEIWALVVSLGSVKGWRQIYTGYKPAISKKFDNGPFQSISAKAGLATESPSTVKYLGTRPAELKPQADAQLRGAPYSSYPILPRQDVTSPPTVAASQVSTRAFPGPEPFSQAPQQAPFQAPQQAPRPQAPQQAPLSTGTPGTPPAVYSNPLPAAAIGTSPGFASSRPAQAQLETTAGPVSHASEEAYTDDDDLSVVTDDAISPEAPGSTGSKIKKLRKRISSKLKGTKA